MAIATQGGLPILKDGILSCSCCDGSIVLGDVNFGNQGSCNCDEVLCYNATTNPSPATLVTEFGTYTNQTPNSNRVTIGRLTIQPAGRIQGPIFVNDTIVGWNNFVSEPSIVRVSGTVGGDIELSHYIFEGSEAFGFEFPANFEAEYEFTQILIGEGEYPCGICDTPRNGPHPISHTFVMFPYTYVEVNAVSFLQCFPWFRLTIQRLGPLPP